MSSAPLELGSGARAFEGGEPALWRGHSDEVNRRFLARQIGERRFRRALKTDLFDEAVTDGVIPLLLRCADEVCGIDLLPEVATAAGEHYPDLIAGPGDVRELAFEDESFDLIVSLSTLDHLESKAQIETAVAELARVLAPGGILILTLDNPLNPVIALRQALPNRGLMSAGLVSYPLGPTVGPRRLATMVEGAGLIISEREALMHAPRVAAVALARRLRSEPARRSFRRRAIRLERLAGWPTRYLTGHFSAIVARPR